MNNDQYCMFIYEWYVGLGPKTHGSRAGDPQYTHTKSFQRGVGKHPPLLCNSSKEIKILNIDHIDVNY